jgi:hypothetical protein
MWFLFRRIETYRVIPRLFSLSLVVPGAGSLMARCMHCLWHTPSSRLSVPTAAAFSKSSATRLFGYGRGIVLLYPTFKKSFGHIFILVIHRHSVFWQLNNPVICSFVTAGPNTLGVFEGDTR